MALRLLLLLLAMTSACSPPPADIPARAQPLALTGVSVVDVEGGTVLPEQTVVINGSRIAEVGPSEEVRVPAGARVIDARGKFLIPGLWDMHVHTSREGRARYFWPLFLAHGVTGVREMGSYLDTLQHWRAEAQRNPESAPRIIWSSPMLDGTPPSWVHGIGVRDAAHGRELVDSMQALGFDFLKVYDRLPRDVYFAIADQAKRRGIPFAGHIPEAITPAEASNAGQASFEHVNEPLYLACIPGGPELLDSLVRARTTFGPDADSTHQALSRLLDAVAAGPDPATCRPTLELLAANNTWLNPTLTVVHGALATDELMNDPRLRFVPPALAERWRESRSQQPEEQIRFRRQIEENTWQLVGLAEEAGVGILAGTDASDEAYVFAGSGLHDELALLVRAGLSPLAALRAATLNPARYLGATDSLGTVAAGKLADLVLLDANPLLDIRNTGRIHAVIHNGRLIGPEERAALLRTAADEAARATISPPARQ